jgi:ACS family allantoate permease-like MFS transporter
LFLTKEAPVYGTAFLAAFICFALNIVLIVILRFYLVWENKRRDRLAAAAGGEPGTREGDEFLDMTDKQQKAIFRYVL